MNWTEDVQNQVRVLILENEHLRCSIAPALGGKIISVYNKQLDREFLWSNENLPLAQQEAGADYDANFWGGIDELLPNDLPETINGIPYPDHGELWTTPLAYQITGDALVLSGTLPLSGLFYRKTVTLDAASPAIMLSYQIRNTASETRHFLWKLHAAVQVQEGDRVVTSARKARVVDTAYSRFSHTEEFQWPLIEETDASLVPARNNTMDFFYLYDAPDAEMALESSDQSSVFSYRYDGAVFPYQWLFASYGAFLDHYTLILEPCTTMPISVQEAMQTNQCSVLQPGAELETTVRIYAGPKQMQETP